MGKKGGKWKGMKAGKGNDKEKVKGKRIREG
jgi:hypothetical protein